jgi:hypothetical protein
MAKTERQQLRWPRERRGQRRATYARLLRFLHEGSIYAANAREISETGVRLEVPWELPLRSSLKISLPLVLRGSQPVECMVCGEVVRRRGDDVGVAFTRLRPRERLVLRDFVYRARPHI